MRLLSTCGRSTKPKPFAHQTRFPNRCSLPARTHELKALAKLNRHQRMSNMHRTALLTVLTLQAGQLPSLSSWDLRRRKKPRVQGSCSAYYDDKSIGQRKKESC